MHTHQDQQTHLFPPGGFGEGYRHLGLQAALGGLPCHLGYVPPHLHSEVVPKGDVGHALGGLQHQVVASVHAVPLALVTLGLRWTNQRLHFITIPDSLPQALTSSAALYILQAAMGVACAPCTICTYSRCEVWWCVAVVRPRKTVDPSPKLCELVNLAEYTE